MLNLKNYVVGLTFIMMLSLFLLKKIQDRNRAKNKRIQEKRDVKNGLRTVRVKNN